jgi:ribosomal protein S18 acetylase RimI-like enzyme
MELDIRSAAETDIPAIIALMREFAEYEDLSKFLEITEERLYDAMFGIRRVAEGLCAFDGEKAIGYAIFYPNFASFRGQVGFYLEDIYIKQEYRGRGVGEAMLKHIARVALSRGYERIDFMVLDRNESGIGFYKKLGAVMDTSERHFKFTDRAFKTLAE